MRDFLLVGSWEYSGSGKGMTYYGEALAAAGYTVTFLSFGEPHDCMSHPKRYQNLRRLIVQVAILPFDSSPQIAMALALVNDILHWLKEPRRQRPVLWGHYLYPYGIACLLAAAMWRQSGGDVKVLLTPAGSDVWNPDLYLEPLVAHACQLGHLSGVVFYSARFREEALKGYSCLRPYKPSVVMPVVSDSHFTLPPSGAREEERARLGIPANVPVLSVVSNMRARKNLDSLAQIITALELSDLPLTILLVGPARPVARLEQYDVVHTGVVADVRQLLWASDLSLNVSTQDSFNFALLEAMLCGVPAMSTIHAAITDTMVLLDRACVFDPSNTSSLKDARLLARHVLTNGQQRAEYGSRQRQFAVEHFGTSHNCARLAGEIEAILQEDI